MENIKKFKAHLTELADNLREANETTEPMSLSKMVELSEGLEVPPETYILVDENGNEYPAVMTAKEVILTADAATDIRKGTVAVTDKGVVTGEKEIPAYHVTQGSRAIPDGRNCEINVQNYEYTKLQAVMCLFNTDSSNSVAADRVVIDSKVYPVQSTIAEASVTTKSDPGSIDFGITNTSGKPYLIRYFSYKEIY